MSESLFTAPLGQTTADDVNAFLDDDVEEGPRLDYKEADRNQQGIPDTIVRPVVAFANTYGGLIIVGVEVDRATNRPGKREGVLLKKGLEEKITSLCYSGVIPPVAPEVRVCPFKSAPTLSEPDRAFVIIRVQESLAAPHTTRDNQILVRVGSQCLNADLSRLRFMFERERQREQLIEQLRENVWKGHLSTRKQFMNFEGGPWKLAQDRIYLDFMPVDTSTDLLPFESPLSDNSFLDENIQSKLASLTDRGGQGGGMMKRLDGTVRLQRGLGVLGRWHGPRGDSVPASALYVDRGGGIAVDFVAAGFDYSDSKASKESKALFLWMAVVEISDLACGLLREHGYSGRIGASVWATSHLGEIAPAIQERDHYGETSFSPLDPKPERSEKLGLMINRMSRTWLSFKMPLKEWIEKYSNEFIRERSF